MVTSVIKVALKSFLQMRSECDITDCLSLFMKEEILDGHESPVSFFFLCFHTCTLFYHMWLLFSG